MKPESSPKKQTYEFYELVHSHRSIRKYKPDAVPEVVLDRIFRAGTRASSSGNMQPYSVIVTTSAEIKKELLPLHFEQSMVTEAPVLLTFCSDFHRMRLWLEQNEAPENFDNLMSFLIGMIDATLVSQNMALAAEAEGLGICYMGTTLASAKEIAKVLRLPKHVVPVVGYSLGYPAEAPEIRDRLPLEAVIHRERYQEYHAETIQKIHKQKETTGMRRYMANPDLKQKIVSSGVSNLAQVYTKIKYTRESHQKYSNDILDCLRNQDFFHS